MEGWVDLVGWPIADILMTIYEVVTCQPQIRRWSTKLKKMKWKWRNWTQHKRRRHVVGVLSVWANTWKLENSNSYSYSRIIFAVFAYFDWCIIPHTTVGKQFSTLHCWNIVYLQHGGGSYRRQNDVTVSPCIYSLQTGRWSQKDHLRDFVYS